MTRRSIAALAVALSALLPAAPAPAQTVAGRLPVGLWLTEDHEGVIRIAPCGENLCGSIAGQIAAGPEVAARCSLPILTVAPARPGLWTGQITNPEDGRVWSAQLWEDAQGQLHLRGYVGLPLLGATQTWTRYTGRLEPGCRMA